MKSMIAKLGFARLPRRALCLAVGLTLGGACGGVLAQDAAAPSTNATINLIRLMVKKGLLTQADADGLLAQANAEATQARNASATPNPGAAVAGDGAQPGDVRVTYVPQNVRNEIREQVKQEVIAQAKSEHWAEPNALPEWLDRISWSGDVKVRDESWYYSRNNSPYFIDYATLNRTGPVDVGAANPQIPVLNTQQNRLNMLRMQAHLALTAKLGDTVTAGVRIGSGNDNNPVSTTATLGGGLDKKNLWLDRAWIKWQPNSWSSLTAGRMANPFMATELIYSPELNFDGIAGHFDLPFNDDLGTFATVGAFPIEFTSPDSPTDADGTQKNRDYDKWMTAAQIGASWKFDEDTQLKLALAYYYFSRMRGSLSAPCDVDINPSINFCSTDDTAPQYMQKGNTVFLLRDIVPPVGSSGAYPQPQFVGLAYNYHLANLTGQFDFKVGGMPVRLLADYVRNMAYHERDAFDRYPNGLGQPVNNYQAGPVVNGVPTNGPYKSGPVGWLVRGIVGTPNPMAANEWNVSLGYKYLQPDAVLDGLTDQNFHLGGTNAKGFFISTDYGIAQRTWLSARYFNAREVFGPPFSLDILQLEMSTKF